MTTDEIIYFGITFLSGAWVTGLIIVAVLGLARGIEQMFFSVSRKWLEESRAGWMERCGELEEEVRRSKKDFKQLSDKYMDLSKKFNENTIERISLKEKQIRDYAVHLEVVEELRETKKELEVEKKNLNPKKLSPKYNPNVTRGADGRYKSFKIDS